MKKLSSIIATLTMIFIVIIMFNFAGAQSQSVIKSFSALQVPDPAAVQFTISIPDEFNSHIVRENGDNAVYYNFKKSDGTTAFLFQVNKISESQWINVKNQLSNPTLLAHRDGYIYYAQSTDKNRIKGADNEAYQQIYERLPQLIGSIVITESATN